MLNHKYLLSTLLIIFPLISSAHGITDAMIIWMVMAMSTLITLSHAILILVFRWAKWFKYAWLMKLSLFISSLNILMWFFSLITYTQYVSDILRREGSVTALVLFSILLISFAIIIWTFKKPKKQYLQLNDNDNKG